MEYGVSISKRPQDSARKRLAAPTLWHLRRRRRPHAAGPGVRRRPASGARPLTAVTTADLAAAAYSAPGPLLGASHESFPPSKQTALGR